MNNKNTFCNPVTTEYYKLDLKSVDDISKRTSEFLMGEGAENREVMSKRLAVECCLEIWRMGLGEENQCILQIGSKHGRKYLLLKTPGPMKNPSSLDIEMTGNNPDESVYIDNFGFLEAIGYTPEYQYIKGNNTLRIWAPAPRKKLNIKVMLPVVIGMLILLVHFLSPSAGQILYEYVVNPVYTTFMRMLSAICGPLVLLSVLTSICGMGDMASFGKTGYVVVKQFLMRSFGLSVVACAFTIPFFKIEGFGGGEMGTGLQQIIQMFVEIVPSDIVSPFASGNALQIVFMSVIVGLAFLYLSDSVSNLTNIVSQLQRVVFQIMHFLGSIMPYFMVVAILNLFMTCTLTQIAGLVKPVFITIGLYLLLIVLNSLYTGITTKTSVAKLIKSTCNAALIALMTASSTAAMDKMISDCNEKLGVEEKIVNFAIPLGQAIFKPAATCVYFVCSLYVANIADISINPIFIFTSIIISWILGISTAPVPGALVAGLGIMFLQLGIPQDYVSIGISMSLLLDNIGTMTNVQLLQEEVYSAQKSINKQL